MFILGYVKSILFEQLDVDATTALKICLDQDIPPDAILNQYHKIKLHGNAYCSETGETEYGMVVSFFTIKLSGSSRDLSVIKPLTVVQNTMEINQDSDQRILQFAHMLTSNIFEASVDSHLSAIDTRRIMSKMVNLQTTQDVSLITDIVDSKEKF